MHNAADSCRFAPPEDVGKQIPCANDGKKGKDGEPGTRLLLPSSRSAPAAARRVAACVAIAVTALAALTLLAGCGGNGSKLDPQTAVILIESSPTSLDPRIGIDAQAEHIDELIFDPLVHKDAQFNLQPWVASSWETPDPLTYIFHLRRDVYFQNGKRLDADDVKWTLDTMRNGTLLTAKGSAYEQIDRVDAPSPDTVAIHLKQPDASLLWNLSDGAMGIVPAGSGRDFGFNPIGSGPFRFVSQRPDRDVILVRNDHYWQTPPAIPRIRFAVAPDAITRALELDKGSADACINCLTPDMVDSLAKRRDLVVSSVPGTSLNYLAFNTQDPILKDVRVRQAIACAINRPLIIHSLWRDRARLAESLLPSDHWAWNGAVEHYSYDPANAKALLDQAGWKPGKDGIRFHLSIKTSTDETARLLALVLQEQLRAVGIDVQVRSFEFATFFADVTRGAFQMYTLRWEGGNEDPDIYRYAYTTAMFPPRGANRGRYSNPEVDKLIEEAGAAGDQSVRRRDYARVQQILSAELPTINLWYLDTVMVHNRRLSGVRLSPSGSFDFLKTATLAPAAPPASK